MRAPLAAVTARLVRLERQVEETTRGRCPDCPPLRFYWDDPPPVTPQCESCGRSIQYYVVRGLERAD